MPPSPDDAIRRFPAFLPAPVRAGLLALAGAEEHQDKWQAGRQGTGYEKLDLRASGLLESERGLLEPVIIQAKVSFGVELSAWDAYLLRYRDGSCIPEHTDPTGPQNHLRLNAIIASGEPGSGELRFRDQVIDLAEGDAVCFHPDRVPHRVSVVRGERVVLSVGCVY